MLTLSLIESIGDWFNNTIHRFLLVVDQSVYWFASQCYQLFIKLATARIFDDNFFANFAKRIYAILGVFMLFYLAYALLTAIVDPEKLTKGDKGVGKIASNLIVSLVIVGLLPSIFDYAYRLQNYILSSNLLGTLILGTDPIDVNDTDENNNNMLKYGDAISFTVLNTFLNPENVNVKAEGNYTWFGIKNAILDDGDWQHLQNMYIAVSTGVPIDGKNMVITYRMLLSTVAGVILIYLMLSFTLDLGIRVVKFAFYQLIAPIPVIMRILPSKKSVFDKWLKQTLSVYFEVFVRVGSMFMAIYFINELTTSNTLSQFWQDGGVQGKVALVVIIMGILAFAKQLPKIISDTLGIDTGGLKLGIMDKLKAGGFFAGGAMLGGGLTSMVQNFTGAGKNVWRSGSTAFDDFRHGRIKSGFLNAGGALVGLGTGAASVFAGGASGAFHAYGKGKDAKSFKDMRGAAAAGAKASAENRDARAARYTASKLNIPVLGGPLGVARGVVTDAWDTASSWAGISSSMEDLKRKQNVLQDINSKRKAAWDAAKAEMLKKVQTRTATQSVHTAGNAIGRVDSFANLSELDNLIDIVKNRGTDSEGNALAPRIQANYLNELQSIRSKLEDQLTTDYLNGYDESGRNQDVNNINGQVKEAMIAYHTAIANNVDTVFNNLTSSQRNSMGADINTIQSILRDTKNMNIDDLMSSFKVSNLMDAGKRVSGTASSNVGSEINRVIQNEQEKKK